MRILRAAALLAVMLSSPVFAQGIKPSAPTDPPKGPGELETEKNRDQAYKKSLRNIPDQPPADPWGGARAIDGSSSNTTPPPPKRTKANSGSN